MFVDPAGKDPIFQPEEYSARDKREPRQFPEGVFGQKYPQNITTKEGFPSVDALKVKPEAQHKDADKVGLDGLPHVGAVVWPSESYYSTVDRMTCKSSVLSLTPSMQCVVVVVQICTQSQGRHQHGLIFIRRPHNAFVLKRWQVRTLGVSVLFSCFNLAIKDKELLAWPQMQTFWNACTLQCSAN